MHHRYLARGHIGNHGGYHEGTDTVGAFVTQDVEILGEGGQSTHATTNHDADFFGGFRGGNHTRHADGFVGGGDSKMNEPVVAPYVLAIHVVGWIEIFDFATKPGLEVAHITLGDWPDTAFGCADSFP